MVLLVSGCATTGKVDQMIDSNVTPQIEQINEQLAAQAAASKTILEDMKGFVARIGNVLDENVKELQAEVDGLKSQLSSLKTSTKSDVNTVEGDISKLDSSVSSLSKTVGSLKDAVDALELKTADAKAAADAATKTAARAISGAR